MKYSKYIVLALITLFTVFVTSYIYVNGWYRDERPGFQCDRNTKEIRETDKYCDSYFKYYIDFFSTDEAPYY